MNNLGDLLREAREKSGYTVQEAADLISVSRMTLSRLESNKTKLISFDTILNISNNMQIDLCEIIISYKKKLRKMELTFALKAFRKICYNGVMVDKKKLKDLIENNLNDLQAEEKEELSI